MAAKSSHSRGPTYARDERPRFEFKPSSPGFTGGGYARIRSSEYREHTPGQQADDVYVAVHRLAAVAWHLPDGTLGEDVFLSDLAGMDVHHVTPDGEASFPSANGEDWTTLVEHGRHSSITNTERRAWAEDAKADAAEPVQVTIDDDKCDHCGEVADVLVTADAFDGQRCLECGQASGATDFDVV